MSYDLDFIKEHQILRTLHGSQAYGTARPDSDRDEKAIFLLPPELLVGMETVKRLDKDEPVDLVAFSLQNALEAVLSGTPNVIEILFVDPDDVLDCDRAGEKLLDHRDQFVSKSLAKSYFGFARGQSEKLRHANNLNEADRRKTAYQMIRTINCANEVLREHRLHTKRPEEERSYLQGIREGEEDLDEALERFDDRRSTFDRLMEESDLRSSPDGSTIHDLYRRLVRPELHEYFCEEEN